MAVLLLVRHGRSTANTAGTLAGWTPGVALDDAGRDGAAALATRLEPVEVTRLVSSPLQRCRETAAILAERRDGLPVEQEEGLGECRYGAWTGRKISDLAKDPLWRTVQDAPSSVTFPSGGDYPAESLQSMWDRAVAAVQRIDREVEEKHGPYAVWVAVSHGDVIKSVIAHALGLTLDQFQRIVVGPGSLSVIHYTEQRPFVLRTNDGSSDLAALLPKAENDANPGDATPGGDTGAREAVSDDGAGRQG